MADFESCDKCKHSSKSPTEYPCNVCIHNAVDKFEPKTNADKVREMSDELMADFLAVGCLADIEGMECKGDCTLCFLKWLKSEAKG